MELTHENWEREFGDGTLTTPLEQIKIGENQFSKMVEKGREKEAGMIKPTFTDPDFIIEVPSEASDGNTERPTSHLYVKAFIGKDGKKRYFFKSVTIKKDGLEINISNHFDRAKRLREALEKGKLLYRFDGGAQTEQRPADVSVTASADENQGSSAGKGSGKTANEQGKGEKVAEGEESVATGAEDTGDQGKTGEKEDKLSAAEKQVRELLNPYKESLRKWRADGNPEALHSLVESGSKIKDFAMSLDPDVLEGLVAKGVFDDLDGGEKNEIEDLPGVRKLKTHAFEETIRKQGKIEGQAKPAKKTDPFKFVLKGKEVQETPAMAGKCYTNGYEVCSDGYVLIAVKSDYPKEKEGIVEDKNGNRIEGKYPHVMTIVKSVKEKSGRSVKIDVQDMRNFLQGVLDKAGKKGTAVVSLRMPDGMIIGVEAKNAKLVLDAMDYYGIDTLNYSYETQSMLAANDKASLLITPVFLGDGYRNIEDTYCYDLTKGEEDKSANFHKAESDNSKKEAGVPVTEEEAALRDELNELMREAGMPVIDDVEGGQRVLDMANGAQLSKNKKRALETASLSQEETNHPTVIPSADGAKVLKNLDTLVNDFENLSNYPKFFIGSLARALGAKKHGSNSEYATFETKNGRVVTIRLANHNAKVSTFDNHNESEGISIVITANNNGKLINDGNAHVTEFYYNALKLRRAEGKPLADIVRSIKQALYSGEFKDTTGLAERQEVNADDLARLQKVYHGSGADFDHFDTMNHLGEGEGSQAFGAGTYVSDQKGIGLFYAKIGARDRVVVNGKEYIFGRSNNLSVAQNIAAGTLYNAYYGRSGSLHHKVEIGEKDYVQRAIQEIRDTLAEKPDRSDAADYIEAEKLIESGEVAFKHRERVLYTVEIPDDNGKNYLDWNAKVGVRLLNKVNKHLEQQGKKPINPELSKRHKFLDGNDLYRALSIRMPNDDATFNDDKAASEFLSSLGFVGIKYPAGSIHGGAKEGDTDYVIFNDKDLKITDKVKFFRTANGEAYGFTVGGKIYIDPRIATAETSIHEYTHLWAEALRKANPKEWQNVVKLMKGTWAWDYVKRLYPELKTDDEVAEEALAHYSGRRGAERLREAAREEADKAKGVMDKAAIWSAFAKIKDALGKFWKHIAEDFLHIHFTSAEEVADKVMYDLLNGFNPNKFNLSKPVEKGKDLIAVHNLTEDKLKQSLELGGFPMPSIAITKTSIGHVDYGDISLLFGKDTINPSDRRNKVYSGDAWTPTFPQVSYKLDEKKSEDIYSRALKVGNLPFFKSSRLDPEILSDRIDRKDLAEIIESFKKDYGMKQMFLSEMGNPVKEYVQKTVDKFSPEKVDFLQQILDKFGVDGLRSGKYDDELKQIVGSYRHVDLDSVKPYLAKLAVQNALRDAIDFAENGNKKVEYDVEATQKEIDRRIDPKEYDQWLHEMLDGIIEKKGIRNNTDPYTRSGNRREWESLYDAVTLDNVLKAMKAQPAKSGGFFSTIFGASAKELSNLNEVREEAKRRIKSVPEEEFKAEKDKILSRLEKISLPSVESSDSISGEMDFVENVKEAVVHSHTPKGIYKYLSNIYPDMSMDVANEIADVVKDIQAMSTRYLEAKPYRAVGFDEVKAAVIPSDTDTKIVQQLKDKGIPVYTYEKGNAEERRQVVNDAAREQRVKFHKAEYGDTPMGNESARKSNDDALFRLGDGNETFAKRQRRAVENKGTVAPGLNSAEVKVVEVPRHDFTGTGKQAIDKARVWAEQNLVGLHTAHRDDGNTYDYQIDDEAVGKYLSSSSTMNSDNLGVHLAVLKKLPEVIDNSIEAEEHPDYKKGEDGVRSAKNGINPNVTIHRLYGAVRIDGKVYRVKVTLKEDKTSKEPNVPHSYEATKIELFAGTLGNSDNSLSPNTNNSITAAKLLNGVEKSYGGGKFFEDYNKVREQFIGEQGAERADHAEERRASLAAETEDVSREDQLSLFGNNEGGSYSLKDGGAHLGRGKNVGEASDAEGYTAFANQYGVDAEVVKDYASGMKTGNLQKAERALAEIRRTMRVANRGMNFLEFGKLFRPVKKELTERYGDIEKLRQEYIDAARRERGVMEAARKRAEEEETKRKARADELSLLSTEEVDKRYFDAIENGDDATAREMLDEAARRKGYDDTESDYQGVGAWSAPSNPGYESDAERRADVEDNAPCLNLEDMALGYQLQPDDYFTHPERNFMNTPHGRESSAAIRTALEALKRGEKGVKVKVYRAVPTSVKEGKLRNGDWVTPSKKYAEMHGNGRLEGKYRIIEDEVPASELWWDGNDGNEWGFDDGRGYKYKNVEHNRKLNDLVTRDDNGEIIPPSKRFDENVEDVRYRESEPMTLKGEEALAAKGTDAEEKRKTAEEMAQKLHLDNVNIVTEPVEVKDKRGRIHRPKGSYSPSTGRITVYVANNVDVDDVIQSILHEGVAHHGLRQLFGKHFADFLRDVYRSADENVRRAIAKLATGKYHGNFETATEEYLGSMAEEMNFESVPKMLWIRIRHLFEKMLRAIGLKSKGRMSDNELRYILWKSYKNLKAGGKSGSILDKAEDVAKQYELKVGNYAEDTHPNDDAAETEAMRRKTGLGETKFSDGKREQQTANERFNNELTRYQNGEMDKNEMLHLGRPQGVMRAFLPNLPIVMRQRILTKGSVKKHNVAVEALVDMPNHLSHPIFVFKRSDNVLGVLTEMQDRDGKNVCVAIELSRQIQNGGEILEVNDIRSIHGREISDIVYPILKNGTLKWVDKKKGLSYLSSASRYVQQEIDKQDLDTATKVVKDFVNPKVPDENVADEGIMFRDGDMGLEETITKMKVEASQANADNWQAKQDAMRAIGGNLPVLRLECSIQAALILEPFW